MNDPHKKQENELTRDEIYDLLKERSRQIENFESNHKDELRKHTEKAAKYIEEEVDYKLIREYVHDLRKQVDKLRKELDQWQAAYDGSRVNRIVELEEELKDWRDCAIKAALETCGDEHHCTCVPSLRKMNRDLIGIIAEYTNWDPERGPIEHIKPGHGPCCTCQECGYHYDDCVCEHNAIEKLINPC